MALGLCTEEGSPTSHIAVFARGMGLPTVVGADLPTLELGTLLAFNGETGEVYIDPSPEVIDRLRSQGSSTLAGGGPGPSAGRGLPLLGIHTRPKSGTGGASLQPTGRNGAGAGGRQPMPAGRFGRLALPRAAPRHRYRSGPGMVATPTPVEALCDRPHLSPGDFPDAGRLFPYETASHHKRERWKISGVKAPHLRLRLACSATRSPLPPSGCLLSADPTAQRRCR